MGYMRGVLAVSGGGVETIIEELSPPLTRSVAAPAHSVETPVVADHGQHRLPVIDLVPSMQSSPSSIEFRNVTFYYKPRTYHSGGKLDMDSDADQVQSAAMGMGSGSEASITLLKNVSFNILPGENVAIVGPSGSG